MLQSAHDIEEISALGIHVVSLHEWVDASTPNGRLVVGIFASISEFERELIRSRIRSGLAAARAKGKRLGRPQTIVDVALIATLRAQGLSWPAIGKKLNVGVGTAYRAYKELSKNPEPGSLSRNPDSGLVVAD